ncbi:MAG: nucleotidyltransferase family protein [Myxococcales bacterium]|nr:nucleotidyltransferase family protein [Myxococcales bacterium]
MDAGLLDEKIVALERALSEHEIPHAFGGALALAYYATPRGTVDIDLNIFLPSQEAERALRVMAALGVRTGDRRNRAKIERDGQVRVIWEHTPVDLFFSYDPLHDRCMERCRGVPFGDGDTLSILSAEDLVIFKVLFDRPKDWTDIGEVLYAQGRDFDSAYTLDWLSRILDEADPRLQRFKHALSGSGS